VNITRHHQDLSQPEMGLTKVLQQESVLFFH